jgi:uncharacterized membrane protein (UPF0182 family)
MAEKHLIYTHGYGLAMSRVDRVTPDGLPEFLIKDIPPKSFAGISVDRPEIYYGEGTDDYVITNTSISPGSLTIPLVMRINILLIKAQVA